MCEAVSFLFLVQNITKNDYRLAFLFVQILCYQFSAKKSKRNYESVEHFIVHSLYIVYLI